MCGESAKSLDQNNGESGPTNILIELTGRDNCWVVGDGKLVIGAECEANHPIDVPKEFERCFVYSFLGSVTAAWRRWMQALVFLHRPRQNAAFPRSTGASQIPFA